MCPFCTNLIETAKHCLWSCGFAMDIWKRSIKLFTPVYPRAMYTWGAVLWAVVHDKPMVYEQEDVADAIVMRHGLMEKKLIPLNPQIQTDKPQIWQLVSSITIWYIWKARCLKVFQNVIERPTQIISGIWIEIVHNLRGLLDSIKGNTHQADLKRLEFHAIWDIGIFYRRYFGKVEWFYSTPKCLFKPVVRI